MVRGRARHKRRRINLDVVADARAETFLDSPPNVWLLERSPWSEVEHVISAVAASARDAARLEVETGDAHLSVERRTWVDAHVITYVRMLHPGRFYRLRAFAGQTPRVSNRLVSFRSTHGFR